MSFSPHRKNKPLWMLLASLSLALLVVVFYVGSGLERSARKNLRDLTRSNDDTRRAIAALSGFSDEALRKARAQADMFRATLLAESRIPTFEKSQAPFWRVTEAQCEQTLEYRKLRLELSREGAPMSDWPQIVETVQSLQGSPGMTVRQLEISTTGDASRRVFERVKLGVTLFVRLNNNSTQLK